MNKYEEIVKQEYEKFMENQKCPNIMLLGATGCGKSSLVNRVFGIDIAKVSDNTRGTYGFDRFVGKDYGISVNLVDSKGYEIEDGDSFRIYFDDVHEKLHKCEGTYDERIHMIWYCISAAAYKIQDMDIELLKALMKEESIRDRVAVVITKCDQDDEDGSTAKIFRNIIREDIGGISVFEVSDKPTLPLELDLLMKWSADALAGIGDKEFRNAFIASQKVDLHSKKKEAGKIIAQACAAAAGVGAVPIPFSDSAALVPIQLTMATRIINAYGMTSMASISKALISNVVISTIGKSLAGNLIKIIPAIGKIVGGLIDATVAAGITAALGSAISEICYRSCKDILMGKNVDFEKIFSDEAINTLMKNFMKVNKNKDFTKSETIYTDMEDE